MGNPYFTKFILFFFIIIIITKIYFFSCDSQLTNIENGVLISLLALSAPSQFSAEKKIFFFLGNFIATLVFKLKRKILSSFFSQLIELFHRLNHRTMKKIKNPAKYELFLPKPLTLNLFSRLLFPRAPDNEQGHRALISLSDEPFR